MARPCLLRHCERVRVGRHMSGRPGLGLVFVGVIETFWDFLQPCYLCRAFLLSFCDHVG
jgi:hypothetical protein